MSQEYRNDEIQIFGVSLPFPPTRSTDNDEYEPELGDLLRAVECPVCRCIPRPPIFNCVNGHFSCASCFPRLPMQRCPYCLAKFTKMRNFPLENLVSARVFICDFRSSGCNMKGMNMMEYEEHMRNCWFRSPNTPQIPAPAQKLSQPPISMNEQRCPRCSFINSKRKLKCQNCDVNLRVPTPMCSRPLWAIAETPSI